MIILKVVNYRKIKKGKKLKSKDNTQFFIFFN